MKSTYYSLFVFAMFICFRSFSQQAANKTSIPLGGNSWVTVRPENGSEQVTEKGWEGWQHANAVWSTWFKLSQKGILKVYASLKAPDGESKIKWTLNGESKTITVTGNSIQQYEIGEWSINEPGYIKIDAQGVSKTGNIFAEATELQIKGSATEGQTAFVRNNEGNYFYWGRRGPSVHINYDLSKIGDDIEWFYNEINVPAGNDVIGSYFMADGFAEGYFGMQVNSDTERRILFSVWSPFKTDDPKEIPEDKKILLLKKGTDVYAGEFGNEGSGGQSYLKYNWKAGSTCKFLLHASPAANNYTNYTAWFYAPEKKQWLLIASFSRPHTTTYLKKLHSFLENFEPETGFIPRKAIYKNQWVKTKAGEWKPVTAIQFTGDATANIGYRLDYDGGVKNGKFYLRNCGFFDDNTVLKTKFSVPLAGKKPVIDFSALENLP